MADLIEWLRAQLDSDERDGAESRALAPGDLHWSMPGWLDRDYLLADIQAKRRILDACDWDNERVTFGDWTSCSDSCPAEVMWQVAQLLALPYATRDGYREEWRP